MALDFNGSTSYVSMSDFAGMRFPQGSAWSFLAFFKGDSFAADDGAIASKWTPVQFLLRYVQDASPPTAMEVWTDAGNIITGGNVIELDTWYLACVVCDGSASSGDTKLYVAGMDGTYLDDGVSGTHGSDNADLTSGILFGIRQVFQDEFDGSLAYICYTQVELAKAEITAYLRNPYRMATLFKARQTTFFWPMPGFDTSMLEWLGSGNNGTLNSVSAAAADPPVGLWTPQAPASVPLIGTGAVVSEKRRRVGVGSGWAARR